MSDNVVVHRLTPDAELFRIYRSGPESEPRSPVWFCAGTEFRFDLSGGAGTCYVSESRRGAFIEVFQRVAGLGVPSPERLNERSLACLSATDRELVDLTTNANAGAMGADADLVHEVGPPYPHSREFAERVRDEGLSGVRWWSVRDMTATSINCAVFSLSSGEDTDKVFSIRWSGPIPEDLVMEMAVEFGGRLDSSRLYPGGPTAVF